jgi:hypothetical protein
MDPLTARMRCLELADDLLSDEGDVTFNEVILVATAYWDWVMLPFRIEDPTEDDPAATRQ